MFGLNIGPIPVDLEWTDGDLSFAWMTQRPPTFGPIVSAARRRWRLRSASRPTDLADNLPVQEVSCGLPYLLVALNDHQTVDRAVSDTAGFGRLCEACGLDLPIFLFALGGPSPSDTVYGRMFAPEFGIVEDPATGSACGPLGCYLVEHGLVTGDAAEHIVISQGVAMGRASRIHVAIDGRPGAIDRVRVGGVAVLVGRGELLV